jgi:dienelactone hydrolase
MLTSRALLAAAGFFATVVVLQVSPRAQVQRRDIDIRTPDGVILKATYFSPGKPGPGALLLHQCSLNRHAWDDFAADLAGAGIHALAFDYRGFGDTKGSLPPPTAPSPARNSKFGPTVSAGWVGNRDVDLAYVRLRSLQGVDEKRIAVGGASCGAGFASDLAIHHPEIKGLFLLSGQISGGAAAHVAAASWLPVFGAADQGDLPIAYESLQAAIALSKNPKSVMKMYPGTTHGVEMLRENAGLRKMIANWLREVLNSNR